MSPRDLAYRLQYRIKPVGFDSSTQEFLLPCPLGDGVAHILIAANDLGDAVWCDSGRCEDEDVEQAVYLLANQLPPYCRHQEAGRSGHARACFECQLYEGALREVTRDIRSMSATSPVGGRDETVNGSDLEFLPTIEVLFGLGDQILSASGQPWGIFGPDGTGKSTMGEHYAKARLGLPGWETMWDMPVRPLPDDRGVLYLALDRAVQIQQGMVRGIDWQSDRDRMRRLNMKKGVPHNLATPSGMDWVRREVERLTVGLLVIDSRKDIGGTLDVQSIEGINALIRALSNDEVEVLTLGHTREGRRPNGVGPSIEDPSGYREVVSGLGSVVVLEGSPGAITTDVHHVKPIHELVPPFRLQNNHVSGRSTVLGPLAAMGGGGASGGMKFQLTNGSQTLSGTMPTNAQQNQVLAAIDGLPGGSAGNWVDAKPLLAVLGLDKLDRGGELRRAGVIEHNGKKGPQSQWRRGSRAP